MKEYRCSCGRLFKKKQSYATHVEWCQIPKEERSRKMSKQHIKNCFRSLDLSKWVYKNGKWRPMCSKSLAYILGVMKGDGSASIINRKKGTTSYRVHLSTMDLRFATRFMDVLKEIGIKNPKLYIYSDVCHIFAESKLFVLWYKELGLKNIRDEICGYEIDFLRGFYESEGSVSLNSANRKSFIICISNRDLELIMFVKKLLKELGFKVYLRSQKRKSGIDYDIAIYVQEDVLRFFEEVRPCTKIEPKSASLVASQANL